MKRLVVRDYDQPSMVMAQPLAKVLLVEKGKPLFTLLNEFLMENCHMAMVFEDGKLVGIVTLEDVIEEMIQEEIEDESMLVLEKKIVMTRILGKKSQEGLGEGSSSSHSVHTLRSLESSLESERDVKKETHFGANVHNLASKLKRLASSEQKPTGPKLLEGDDSDVELGLP
jgi:CBS domain containing-hemolysin-like protein